MVYLRLDCSLGLVLCSLLKHEACPAGAVCCHVYISTRQRCSTHANKPHVQMLLKAPECGAQLAAQIMEDAVPAEMFLQLLESQSSGVHPALSRRVLRRAARFNLVQPPAAATM